jgi:hypothetical protein
MVIFHCYVSSPEGNQRSFRIYKEPNRNDAIACSCCLLVSAFHFCDNDGPMSLSGSSGPVYIQLRRTRSYLERVRVRASGIEPQFECWWQSNIFVAKSRRVRRYREPPWDCRVVAGNIQVTIPVSWISSLNQQSPAKQTSSSSRTLMPSSTMLKPWPGNDLGEQEKIL